MKFSTLAVAAAGCALLATPALAQNGRPTLNLGDAYLGLEAGAVMPNDIGEHLSGALVGDGNLTFKNGFTFGGFAGYHFTPKLAGEFDVNYARYDMDKLTGFTTGDLSVDGKVTSWTGFANAIYSPLGQGRFTPYIGGGLGFASYESKINSLAGVAVDSKNNATDFAADAVVGVDFAVTPQFAIGARYRFVWINSGNTSTSSGVTLKEDDATVNVITATATYHF